MPFVFATGVSVSRVYEGVHYPRDIYVGAGVGVSLASMYMRVLPTVKEFIKKQPTALRWAYMQAFTTLVYALMHGYYKYAKQQDNKRVLGFHRVHSRTALAEWEETASTGKHSGKVLKPIDEPFRGYSGMIGVMAGLSIGEALLPHVRLPPPTSTPKAVGRGVLGLAGLMSAFLGLRQLEKRLEKRAQKREAGQPEAGQSSSVPSSATMVRGLRFAQVPVFILVIAPAIFKKLGI